MCLNVWFNLKQGGIVKLSFIFSPWTVHTCPALFIKLDTNEFICKLFTGTFTQISGIIVKSKLVWINISAPVQIQLWVNLHVNVNLIQVFRSPEMYVQYRHVRVMLSNWFHVFIWLRTQIYCRCHVQTSVHQLKQTSDKKEMLPCK